MRKKLCLFALLALVAPLSSPQAASAAKTARILVHFARHTGVARQEALIGRIDGRRVANVRRLGTAVISVPAAEKKQALALLQRQAGVGYAETDGIVHAYSVTVNDPYLNSSSWQLANPLFPDAWSLTTGNPSVVVAVVDTGVQPDHPDLGTLVPGYNFVTPGASTADDYGHGTAVAGIIAAQGNNGIGIAGTCWKCEIMPVKVLGSDGSGTESAVADGITWATDHGADVINLSLGGPTPSQTLADAVSYAEARGVVVVAAAGNSDSSAVSYPAADSGVISVGAVKADGTRYTSAEWGNDAAGNPQGSNYGPWVEVDAPGCTNSTWLNSSYIVGNDISTSFCGTSAATPFVSGLAGLARSYNFPASASSVAGAIENTAQTPLSGDANGLIDAESALAAIHSAPAGPVASFSPSVVSGAAPLSVSFANTSTAATAYSWAFGDGATSTVTSPSHTFTAAGSYNVTLVASDGSSSRLANVAITVTEPVPVASFTASRVSGHAPLSVSFNNSSTNASSYLWSFGDGGPSSIDSSPSHTFTKAGKYTVTLTATGLSGQATLSKTITVLKPLADLAVSLVRTGSKLTNGHRLSAFAVRVRNRGGTADQRVKATFRLPSGATFKSVSAFGRSCSRTLPRITCTLGTLSPGEAAKISFVARVVKRVNATVAVSGKQPESSLANNVARAATR